ncbi:hypothetical protein DFP78_1034 [Photobacterium lutimaris]|nr:hypothetical protein DFP78_1034 [Photobacterium lutimaris]
MNQGSSSYNNGNQINISELISYSEKYRVPLVMQSEVAECGLVHWP